LRRRFAAGGRDDSDLSAHQIGHKIRESIVMALRPPVFDPHILALDETASLRPWRNAATMCGALSNDRVCMKPITGAACCALAVSGHAAAPPSSVMNERRFIRSPRRQA
jgi:hypothetical protein